MKKKRLLQQIGICFRLSGRTRANYLRDKHIFGAVGKNCTYMSRKIPLYPELIRFGDNVRCASGVMFITHDRFYNLLNELPECGGYRFKEEIGCIEVGNNVIIGGNSLIYNNVRIGSNVIILAGSVVTRDIPDDTVVQGNPAKKLCSVREFATIRMSKQGYPDNLSARGETLPPALAEWLWTSFRRARTALPAGEAPQDAETAASAVYDEMIYGKLLAYFAEAAPTVDARKETRLVTDHVLDSLELISLLSWITEEFGVSVMYYDITAENFNSLPAIAATVGRLMNEGGAARAAVSKETPAEHVTGEDVSEEPYERGAFRSILEAVLDSAEKHPDKLCLADTERSVTWAEYVDLIQRYAAFFTEAGLGVGDRVVVEAKQSLAFPALELALHAVGAVFVPLENKCGETKLASVAKTCGAVLCITEKALQSVPEGVRVYTYADPEGFAPNAALPELRLPEGEEISEILFSTGTTGKEKGIVLRHRNDVAVAENILFGCGMKRDNVELIPSPLNHSHGLRSYYANMLFGAAVVIADSVTDMKQFFSLMDRYGVNSMDIVPSALTMVLRLSGSKLGEYRNKLRYVEFGSAALQAADKAKIRELLPGTPLLNFYGSTESGRVSVYNFNTAEDKKGCIGKPTVNAEITAVDESHCAIVSSKENTGFLACRGPMNMAEYWQDPEETALAMTDGTVYSKDEIYFDEDGDIILLGRAGDVINVGGRKVAPDEIETAALRLPCIEDCGCVGMKDPITGMVPRLVVQMKEGCPFDEKEILEYLKTQLEPFKVPKKVERVEKIPRTFNGKLLRRML